MNRLSDERRLLIVRHLISGHGVRGAARAAGVEVHTARNLNRAIAAGGYSELVALARRHAPPPALDAMPEGRRERLGAKDGAGRIVTALPAQVKPHPLKPDPNRRRGRPLFTESGKTISHEEVLARLVARASVLTGYRGMGDGAGI